MFLVKWSNEPFQSAVEFCYHNGDTSIWTSYEASNAVEYYCNNADTGDWTSYKAWNGAEHYYCNADTSDWPSYNLIKHNVLQNTVILILIKMIEIAIKHTQVHEITTPYYWEGLQN